MMRRYADAIRTFQHPALRAADQADVPGQVVPERSDQQADGSDVHAAVDLPGPASQRIDESHTTQGEAVT